MRISVYILLCLIWGTTWYAIKIGLADAPPLSTVASRFVLAIPILVIIALVRRTRFPTSMFELLRLAYPGLYMYGFSYTLVYFAELYISSALTAVLFAAFPFFIALLSWLKYGEEKLAASAWFGMAAGFAGVVLISYDSLHSSTDLFLGTLLALAAPLAAAYGILVHKHHHGGADVTVALTVQMAFGSILVALAALLFEDLADFHLTSRVITSIVYLALFGNVVSFLGYYWLLKRIRIVTLSMIAFITPLIAISVGVILADEHLSFQIAIGTALILMGVMAVVRRQSTSAASAGSTG
ncbi:MAG: DMT family transporter [Candidatus Zixiibacteriota bacterium]|nr:MAG: DMT family transporter [candidate division Zixibacteria bacterium]